MRITPSFRERILDAWGASKWPVLDVALSEILDQSNPPGVYDLKLFHVEVAGKVGVILGEIQEPETLFRRLEAEIFT